MGKIVSYRPKLNPDGSRFIDPETNDFVNELVEDYDDGQPIVLPPNWTRLKHDLLETTIFNKARLEGHANTYSTLLKVITDGETSWASENLFKSLFLDLGITLNETEKAEFNRILQVNNFTIQF